MRNSGFFLGAMLCVSVASFGCNNDPGKGKTQATVESAAPIAPAPPAASAGTPAGAAAAAAPAGATNYVFSNDGSKLEWTGAKVTGKHDGSFTKFNGTLQVVENDPTKSSVNVDIDVASISVEPAKLQAHLKTPDLLDATKFPKAKFTSTAIKAGGEKGASHTITGNFELHGVTKSVTFPATIKLGEGTADADAEFVINRKDFGITYPGMPDDLIKDDVLIKLTLRAKKAGA